MYAMGREMGSTKKGDGKPSYICLGDGDFVVGSHTSRVASQDESSTVPRLTDSVGRRERNATSDTSLRLKRHHHGLLPLPLPPCRLMDRPVGAKRKRIGRTRFCRGRSSRPFVGPCFVETRIDVLRPANEKGPQLFVDMGQTGKRKSGFGKPFGVVAPFV